MLLAILFLPKSLLIPEIINGMCFGYATILNAEQPVILEKKRDTEIKLSIGVLAENVSI